MGAWAGSDPHGIKGQLNPTGYSIERAALKAILVLPRDSSVRLSIVVFPWPRQYVRTLRADQGGVAGLSLAPQVGPRGSLPFREAGSLPLLSHLD